MRASLIQIAVDPDESVDARRARAASLVVAQHGADLVVLPELWPVGAFAYTAFEAEAEPLEGPTHEAMAKAAAEAGVWLHAGSFVERADDGTLYNTSLVFSPEGERAAAYRKIHRFGFDQGEAVMMGAGEELVTVALPDTTLGLATCYDLRFPEQFRGWSTRAPKRWWWRRAGPSAGAPTGRSWRRPAPWRTRRTYSPSARPARTRASSRPGTAASSTPGARCWLRRARTRRS